MAPLLVTIRFDGVLAKPIELRLLDDRGAMAALMRYDNAPNRPLGVDLAFRLTSMFLSKRYGGCLPTVTASRSASDSNCSAAGHTWEIGFASCINLVF